MQIWNLEVIARELVKKKEPERKKLIVFVSFKE